MLSKNIGKRCSIDETTLCDEVYTIFSNKDAHGKRGSIIAVVRGTKAEVVSAILMKMSIEERSHERTSPFVLQRKSITTEVLHALKFGSTVGSWTSLIDFSRLPKQELASR